MKKAPFDDKLNDKLLKILEEERASRKAIQESETKFRTLYESAIDAIFIMDDDRFIDCNQSTLKIFGCSSHPEILGHPPYEFSPPLQPDGRDSREKALEMINRAFNGENLRFYWKHAKKDGTAFDAEVTLNRFMVNDKYYLLAIVRDIDKITAIQEKLHLSEERYRLISEVAYDYMFSSIVKDDNSLDLDWVAGAFEKITGYTLYEFKAIGGWRARIHPEDIDTDKRDFELLKQNRKVISEIRTIKKNGDIAWVRVYARPVFDEVNKRLIRIYGAVQDITERKNAELAIRQLEENFHRSIAESPLGIRIVTPEGQTVYANKSFLDIFGYLSSDEYDSIPAIEKYTAKSYAQHVLRKEKRKSGEDVLDYEISIKRKDGEIRELKVLRREILWNGSKHFQVIYQDITEQNNLTRELIAAKEKAEESNRLKTAFLQNVSHEIRTPMNSIMGFMELLKNPNMLREERESFIRMIQESGERLLRTINDLIEISKIETGIVDVRVTTEDLYSIIQYHYNFFRHQAEDKGLAFLLSFPDDLKDCKINVDRFKLDGILINLINNAIKFTKKGFVELGCYPEGDNMVFFVRDSGTGIPEEKQKAVFEPFVQANMDISRPYEGSGLGLSITRAYVKILKGRIWLESKENVGSTFYFSIPVFSETKITEITTEPASTEKEVHEPESSMKILIAEDDDASYLFLKTLLARLGIKEIRAKNGIEVLEIMKNHEDISIILMDLKMPLMDGFEATRKIREFNTTIPIIAQTALAFPSDSDRALNAGCNDYIAKPIDRNELLALIKKYSAQR